MGYDTGVTLASACARSALGVRLPLRFHLNCHRPAPSVLTLSPGTHLLRLKYLQCLSLTQKYFYF